MAGEDDSDKTEEPTQKKLEDAREKGQIPLSREVNHWFMIFAITMLVMVFLGPAMRSLGEGLQGYISQSHALAAGTPAEAGKVLIAGLKLTLLALFLPLFLLLIAAFAGAFLQVGPLYAPDNLAPKLERISLFKGVERLFSKKSLIEFVKSLLKITLVGALIYWLMKPVLPALEHLIDTPLPVMLAELKAVSLRILIGVLCIMTVIAALDILVQRLQFLKEMRMSRTELKDEFKQSEGDPQVKQRIRAIRMERARRRMMAEVPNADVVVTNPDHYAVAMKYDPAVNAAPMVIAMGMDAIALKIKEIARENDVPIVENPPLARALYATAELDREIPNEHFRAVAEIISYVFKLKKKPLRPN